jgi:hypothetical protein
MPAEVTGRCHISSSVEKLDGPASGHNQQDDVIKYTIHTVYGPSVYGLATRAVSKTYSPYIQTHKHHVSCTFGEFGLLAAKPSSEVSKALVQRGRKRETYKFSFQRGSLKNCWKKFCLMQLIALLLTFGHVLLMQ